jgi:hypothetical protein
MESLQPKNSIESKVAFGAAASVLALISIGCLSYFTTEKLISTEKWVAHTQEVIGTLESGLAILTDAETKQRGYLLTVDFQQFGTSIKEVGVFWAIINEPPPEMMRRDRQGHGH